MKTGLVFLVSLIFLVPAASRAEEPRYSLKSGTPADAEAAYTDIKTTLGIVPTFLRQYPPQSIDAAWREMKQVQLSNSTALPPKIKELIGLGVASQIPCTFCVTFHDEAAKLNGAESGELSEAVAIAASSRHWGAFLNGVMVEEAAFRKDVDRAMAKLRSDLQSKPPAAQPPAKQASIQTAAEAYKDMESVFGFVPEFMKQFPEEGIAGAWEDFRDLELNPNTALSAKHKSLISLAVSAQAPCPHCVYWDTQSAKLAGATDREIREAVAMSAITRRWSTVLNGSKTDPAAFKKEVAQIISHVKAQSTKPGKP